VAALDVRPVRDQEWDVLSWLWQCFRHDLALAVSALPYPDGCYQTEDLPRSPGEDHVAYLAWRPHPRTDEPAPVAFALVTGLEGGRRNFAALWVAPVARRDGLGQEVALNVVDRHRGPWSIAFHHENSTAGHFWRRVADLAFGGAGWQEERRAVPHRPDVPRDHWIDSGDVAVGDEGEQ
jgi:hypothetical protein